MSLLDQCSGAASLLQEIIDMFQFDLVYLVGRYFTLKLHKTTVCNRTGYLFLYCVLGYYSAVFSDRKLDQEADISNLYYSSEKMSNTQCVFVMP